MIRIQSRFLNVVIVVLCFTSIVSADQFPTSGDPDIDRVRAEVRATPTNAENFKLRGFLMKQWLMALQQQGIDAEEYLAVDDGMRRVVAWNTLPQQGQPQQFTPEQVNTVSGLIDLGFRILERMQQDVVDGKIGHIASSAGPSPRTAAESARDYVPWPNYKGNPQRTGYTGSPGPQRGETAWKYPVGMAWESRPVVEGNRVYVASPGMRSILQCLDLKTGNPIWIARQEVELVGDQLYSTPAISSTPVVLDDRILVREMGSRGNHGPSRHIVTIDKESGEFLGESEAGHVDYRVGYAAFAANRWYMAIPHGVQDIEATPPTARGFNRIVCRGTERGQKFWEFNIGPTFAEPVIENHRIFVAGRDGYVYCLKAEVRLPKSSEQHIAWKFRAGGAVNRAVAVTGDSVLLGANDGVIYCLDKSTGRLRWKQHVTDVDGRAFRQFSTPLVHQGHVYIGSADRQLHCLKIGTGAPVGCVPTDDWVRARPVAIGDRIFFATLKGTLSSVRLLDDQLVVDWTKSLSSHAILADLVASDDRVLVNSSDLFTHCVRLDGRVAWKRSLLAGFHDNDIHIHTEQIAGGAYFQSKPTAQDGLVFFGTPSRFVCALEAETGREVWKFELGAAVSGAPEFNNGRIYIGQQGGENDFYCLDARTGRPIWSQDVGWVWGSPCVDAGQVFIPEIEGWAYCLNADNGEIVWRYRTGRSLCTEPFVDSRTAYFGGWDRNLYAFDRLTGDLRWKKFLSGGSDSGVPAIANDRIYLPIGGSTFRCLDARTGNTLWKYEKSNAIFNVTPAYHNGRVYISILRGQGMGGIPVVAKIIALDAVTGDELWNHAGGGLTGPVVGRDERVFIASTASPFLYCLDGRGNADGTPKLLWAYRMGDKVEESVPCLYGDLLFILSCDGYLHAVR